MIAYQARFEADLSEGGYVVDFPDLGGYSQGDDEEDAHAMARDLLRTLLADRMARGEEIPPPRRYRGTVYRTIALPVLESAKVGLYNSILESGLRRAELARRMRISRGNVERLFNLNHSSCMDQIEAAYKALGLRLEISSRPAA